MDERLNQLLCKAEAKVVASDDHPKEKGTPKYKLLVEEIVDRSVVTQFDKVPTKEYQERIGNGDDR